VIVIYSSRARHLAIPEPHWRFPEARPCGQLAIMVNSSRRFLSFSRQSAVTRKLLSHRKISQRCGREPLGRRSCPAPRSGLWVREVRPPPHAGNGPGSGPAISLWRRVFRTPPWVSRAISATGRPGQHASVASLVDIWSGHHCRVHWGAIGRATRERLHQMKSEPRFVSRSPILLASVSGHRDEERRFHAG
jgi:hypothetical protein